MIFRKKFSKKEQSYLERVKVKEDTLKTLERSVVFLENQYNTLDEKCLTKEEFDFQRKFLSDKIKVCKNRRDLCKKELNSMKCESSS